MSDTVIRSKVADLKKGDEFRMGGFSSFWKVTKVAEDYIRCCQTGYNWDCGNGNYRRVSRKNQAYIEILKQ